MKRFLFALSIVTLLVVTAVLANQRRNPNAFGVQWKISKKLPPKKVQVAAVSQRDIVQTVSAPGRIELVEEADIASEVVGQVLEVLVEKGDYVQKDQLLVRLDDTDAKARLESTEARIERLKAAIQLAEADLEKAERDLAGFEKLSERGFSTRTELEDGRTMLKKMNAALAMSNQDLKESNAARLNSLQELERTQIRAPMEGTVIDLDVEVGEVVIAGTTNLPGTVLMTIGDMKRMQVRADIDESDVMLVRPEQPSRIFLQANQARPIPGTVELIAPKGTNLNDVITFETLIRVDEIREGIRPEMTSTVEIEVKRANQAPAIPIQAVVQRRKKDLPDSPAINQWLERQPRTPGDKQTSREMQYVKVVFVIEEGKAKAVPVETGISDQQYVEITGGIEAGTEVVTGPFRVLDELKDGQPVTLEQEDQAKKKTKEE